MGKEDVDDTEVRSCITAFLFLGFFFFLPPKRTRKDMNFSAGIALHLLK